MINDKAFCGIFLLMDITELQIKLNNLNTAWQSVRGLL